MTRTAAAALLVAVAARTCALGDLREPLAAIVFAACSAIAIASLARRGLRVRGAARAAGAVAIMRAAGAAAIIGILAAGMASQEMGLAALAVSLAIVHAGAREEDSAAGELPAWIAAIGALSLTLFVLLRCEFLWHPFVRGVLAFSRAESALWTGTPCEIGPTFFGFELLLFFGLTIAARVALSTGRRPSVVHLFVAFALPIALMPLLYLAAAHAARAPVGLAWGREPLFESDLWLRRYTTLGAFFFPSNVRLVAAALVVGGEILLVRPALAGRVARTSVGPRAASIALGALAALAALGMLVLPAPSMEASASRPARVLLHSPQGAYFTPPTDQQVPANPIDFSQLAPLLEIHGYEVHREELSAESLARADILVLVNLPASLSTEDRAAVHRFIEGGGGLLCIGDHTGDAAIRKPFNELLEGSGIAFAFDSARPLGGWGPRLLSLDRSVFPDGDLPGEALNSSGIGIGASLEVERPARELLVGRSGFCDPGNLANTAQGYLGNLLPDFGERLGDVVLAAQSTRGLGRIVVFGDTSSFQSSALVTSHGLVARVFRALERRPAPGFSWQWLAFLAAAAATALGWLGLRPAQGGAALACVVLLAALQDGRARSNDDVLGRLGARGGSRVAFIDAAHSSDLDLWGPFGLEGLCASLARRGKFAALWPRELVDLPPASMVWILAPHQSLTRAEGDSLERFLRGGGRMVIAAGHPHREALAPLLDRLGVTIPFEPLGRFRALSSMDGGADPEMFDGWPVEVRGPHRVLASGWKRPVAVILEVGAGRVAIVGDPRFFASGNLELLQSFNPRNVQFTRALVQALDARAPESAPR